METARTIHAAGIDFHARQVGVRPRALFLHGFGGDLRLWDGVWSALGGELPALRYDLRGFGRSHDDSGQAFDHAEDLLAILDVLGLERCDLVGVSMGGAVALNFALDHPGRVRNLILISPGLAAWEWTPAWRALWRPIIASARAGAMDEARELWWRHPLFETTRAGAGGAELRASIRRYSGAHWVRDNHRQVLPDIERLHALSARTLLLTGARDVEDFRLIADVIETSAPDVTRIDWPACGHLINLEDAPGCAHAILAFLRAAPQD